MRWIEYVGIEIKRVLKDQGSLFLNIGDIPSNQWIAWRVANRLENHLVLQNTVIWVKAISINKSDVGNNSNVKGDFSVGISSQFLVIDT